MGDDKEIFGRDEERNSGNPNVPRYEDGSLVMDAPPLFYYCYFVETCLHFRKSTGGRERGREGGGLRGAAIGFSSNRMGSQYSYVVRDFLTSKWNWARR